ncbi:MAG: zf-HC2 domain-containing protein [Candidatus Polarisedimenticolia bacterium]
MLSCKEVIEALTDYLDDPEALALRRDLEAHLHECKTCRVVYDTSRRTLRIVTEAATFDLPGELSERLLEKTMAGIKAAGRDKPKLS